MASPDSQISDFPNLSNFNELISGKDLEWKDVIQGIRMITLPRQVKVPRDQETVTGQALKQLSFTFPQVQEFFGQSNLVCLCEPYYKPSLKLQVFGFAAAIIAFAIIASILSSMIKVGAIILVPLLSLPAAWGLYTFITHYRGGGKNTNLPYFGEYAFIVFRSKKLYLIPLFFPKTDLGPYYYCDKLFEFALEALNYEVIQSGRRLVVRLLPELPPLLLNEELLKETPKELLMQEFHFFNALN